MSTWTGRYSGVASGSTSCMGARQCILEFIVTSSPASTGWRKLIGASAPASGSMGAANCFSTAAVTMFVLGLLHGTAGVGSPAANCLRRFIYPISKACLLIFGQIRLWRAGHTLAFPLSAAGPAIAAPRAGYCCPQGLLLLPAGGANLSHLAAPVLPLVRMPEQQAYDGNDPAQDCIRSEREDHERHRCPSA